MGEIDKLKIAIPDGRLGEGAKELLRRGGYELKVEERLYDVGLINDSDIAIKIKKARDISAPVEAGIYDLGITGYDLLREAGSDVEELLDLEYGRVDIVVAVPKKYNIKTIKEFIEKMRGKTILAGSEYSNITKMFLDSTFSKPDIGYNFIPLSGKAESFEGDMIVENKETGFTLERNDWQIIKRLFSSTARLIANKESLKNPQKKEKIDDFLMLIKGAKEGMGKRLLVMNAPKSALDKIASILPALRNPTISSLYGRDDWYAIQSVIDKNEVIELIPKLKKAGAEGILELEVRKIIR